MPYIARIDGHLVGGDCQVKQYAEVPDSPEAVWQQQKSLFKYRVYFLTLPCRGGTPLDLATGYCQGSPLGREIEARKPGGLAIITQAIASALVDKFGARPLDTTMQALVVTATKS